MRVFISEDYVFENLGLHFPTHVRVNPDGQVIVMDKGDNCLYIFNEEGEYIKKVGQAGQGPGDLFKPMYLCIDEKGDIYVYEYGNRRISIFSADGKFTNSFRISDAGEYVYMSVTPEENNVLIGALTNGYRMTEYSPNGDIISLIGKNEKLLDDAIQNSKYFTGIPFRLDNGSYYFFEQSLYPDIYIYNNAKELELKFRFDTTPEIKEAMEDEVHYVTPEHELFGRVFQSLYHGVIYKNNHFYVCYGIPDSKEGVHHEDIIIYELSEDLNILKKIVNPTISMPSEQILSWRNRIRFLFRYTTFDVSSNGSKIYFPNPFLSQVLVFEIEK